jgi:mannose-6-phosphate isomerase
MQLISGTIQHYDWGSTDAIAQLQGREPGAQPEAELWFGSHPSAPSREVATNSIIVDLPFLVKVLAAAKPLSIQTHPNAAQAAEGFEREQRDGVAIGAPTRVYRDANHKPEIIVALTPFEALCGFRPVHQTIELLRAIGTRELRPFADALSKPDDRAALHQVMSSLFTMTEGDRVHLVRAVVRDCGRATTRAECEAVVRIHKHFPDDIGCVVALFLNHVVLAPGEAIFLAAGNLHAYVHGVGVEVMATSDNVVRGGLTPKHIDVPELLRVVDTTPLPDPRFVRTVTATPGVEIVSYHPPVADFAVDRITIDTMPHEWSAMSDEIVLCTAGTVNGLTPGTAAIVRAGEQLSLRGSGVVWRVFKP